jgi:hypothetical protein
VLLLVLISIQRFVASFRFRFFYPIPDTILCRTNEWPKYLLRLRRSGFSTITIPIKPPISDMHLTISNDTDVDTFTPPNYYSHIDFPGAIPIVTKTTLLQSSVLPFTSQPPMDIPMSFALYSYTVLMRTPRINTVSPLRCWLGTMGRGVRRTC